MAGPACKREEAKIWIANETTSRASKENCRAGKFAVGTQLVIWLSGLLLITTDKEYPADLLDFSAALRATAWFEGGVVREGPWQSLL